MEPLALSPREYHQRRGEERLREREALRAEVLESVRAAVLRLAPRFPAVQTVYLFGSLVQPGCFRPGSDVDLAVECDDLETESRFWRALEEDLHREVDLRSRRGGVARAVEAYGERCYDRDLPAART
jgi:predicted nucleotidyltransferase